MPILISRCYSETTPESAEEGDFSDTGFVYDSCEFTFRELVRELREFTSLSCSHYSGVSTWACSGFEATDYSTGTEREETLHFSRENAPRLGKYWPMALRAAGLL